MSTKTEMKKALKSMPQIYVSSDKKKISDGHIVHSVDFMFNRFSFHAHEVMSRENEENVFDITKLAILTGYKIAESREDKSVFHMKDTAFSRIIPDLSDGYIIATDTGLSMCSEEKELNMRLYVVEPDESNNISGYVIAFDQNMLLTHYGTAPKQLFNRLPNKYNNPGLTAWQTKADSFDSLIMPVRKTVCNNELLESAIVSISAGLNLKCKYELSEVA
jgi:hypothetical protein